MYGGVDISGFLSIWFIGYLFVVSIVWFIAYFQEYDAYDTHFKIMGKHISSNVIKEEMIAHNTVHIHALKITNIRAWLVLISQFTRKG